MKKNATEKSVVTGKMNAPTIENQGVAGTGVPKISKKEEARLAKQKCRNEKRNGERILNKVIQEDRRQRNLKKKHDDILFLVNNSSQDEIFEQKLQAKRARMLMIFVTIKVPVIKGKVKMPVNARNYYDKSVGLAEAQTLNTMGFFTVAFSGLALLISRNTALDTAIRNFEAKNGTGSAAGVAAAVANVKISVDLLVVYVNGLCIVNQTNAITIIGAAQMEVVKVRGKNLKPDFAVKQGAASGSVVLNALAVKVDGKPVRVTYNWQYGYMVSGAIAWTDVPSTPRCKTTITGLALNVQTFFRKCITDREGAKGGWSSPKDMMVK